MLAIYTQKQCPWSQTTPRTNNVVSICIILEKSAVLKQDRGIMESFFNVAAVYLNQN